MLDELRQQLLNKLFELNRQTMAKQLPEAETDAEYSSNYRLMAAEFEAELVRRCQEANIYEDGKNKDRHIQQFWEEYLGVMMIESGIPVYRQPGKGKPDFTFETDGKTFHIEAKVPTEGGLPAFKTISEKYKKLAKEGMYPEEIKPLKDAEIALSTAENAKRRVKGIPIIEIDNHGGDGFEDGYLIPQNSIMRFARIINDCINHQIKGTFPENNGIEEGDKIILAINGTEAVKNIELSETEYPCAQMCYGYHIFNSLYSQDGLFSSGKVIPIDGIIYSDINPENCLGHQQPLLFFPNPEREDISGYFPFCRVIYCKNK